MSVFNNLIDQDEVIAMLQQALDPDEFTSNAMVHAWLFTGPPGSGRSNVALAFAAALVCPNKGCGECIDCKAALAASHPDVELLRTEGLSIKVDQIRELIGRASWAPTTANWRVIVIEDADRLTESAANALLKSIEEPGSHSVWLLCAPTFTDVLPTIRSRCRSLILRTPSTKSIAQLLEARDGCTSEIAYFAAQVSQGHIGRARHLAQNAEARDRRKAILTLPLRVTTIASALRAAQEFLDVAKVEAETEIARRDEPEIAALKSAYASTGRGLATGGAKALKELEREQKLRATRLVRDSLDRALLDLLSFYRDLLRIDASDDVLINIDFRGELQQMAQRLSPEQIMKRIEALLQARKALEFNAAPLLTLESLMCQFL